MTTELKLNNGIIIPAIGFGTWQMHSSEAMEAVTLALDSGYRLIDTARIYMNEGAVGEALRSSSVPRQDIFVTTKLWNLSHGRKLPGRAFNASLRRMKLDYVDLYLIHWPVSRRRIDSWKALESIHEDGKARAIGVSNFTVRHLKELLAATTIVPAVNQIEFHPFLYKDQLAVLEFCRQHGIVVEAYSPLAHGHRFDDPVLTNTALRHRKSVPQIMLRWAVQHGTIPLPKSSNERRIQENIDIFDFELSAQEMTAINNLSDGLRTCWNPEEMA